MHALRPGSSRCARCAYSSSSAAYSFAKFNKSIKMQEYSQEEVLLTNFSFSVLNCAWIPSLTSSSVAVRQAPE